MSSASLPSTGWLLLVQAEEAYYACVPLGKVLVLGAPCGMLRRCRCLCRRQRVLHCLHLPPFRLQLGPVSFRNISLKRSPTPGFPEILKDKVLESRGREMKCGPDFYHVLQNSLTPLPLWAGPRVGVAALETVWRPLRKLQIEPPRDQQVNSLELTPKIQM